MYKDNKKSNKIWTMATILVLSTHCWGADNNDTMMRMATTSIPFVGVATGGELILAETKNRNMTIAVIQTSPGESAESVANRLAEYINDNDPFGWWPLGGKWMIYADGGVLRKLPPRHFVLAGTEMGLGIPSPAYSFTCTYDSKKNILLFNWENPPEGYDKIGIDAIPTLEGNATSFTIDLNRWPKDTDDLDIRIIGIKNDLSTHGSYCLLASIAGAVHVSGGGRIQEELFGIPFKDGVAPNWKYWTVDGIQQKQIVEGLIRSDFLNTWSNSKQGKKITSDPSTKPFYQLIKTPMQGGTAGICRQFLGLNPGHTYRITARLSTLEMDTEKNEWSFSMHAIADLKNVGKLTESQMAGLAALPDGKKGQEAGRFAYYGPGITTKGEYAMHSTEIALPQDSNSITVWLRHTGNGTSGVGFDWIKLEDLGSK